MPATPLKPRLTRLAVFAIVAATALSVAGCGKSNNDENIGKPSASASATSSAPAPAKPPPPPVPKDEIEGLVDSVSGNTIHLTQRNRTTATVDFTPQTMVTELTPAQLSDVKTGSCVDLEPASGNPPAGGAVTAQSVTIDPPVDGKCPPAAEPGKAPDVDGMVSSVTGNTIAVKSADPTGKTTDTNATVTNTTTYTKHAVTNSQAIQQGKCMAAQGTNSGGALQATTIDLEPCPPMGRPQHHFYIPHIPIPAIPPIPHVPDLPHIPHIP